MINNPILPGFNPDPSIVRVAGDYFIATSTFEWYPGVQVHHSRDLKHWRLISRPLNRKALLDMRGIPDSCGVWAPCLSWCDDKFYLIYTVVKRFDGDYKDCRNYLTTCSKIDGKWSDPIYLNSSGFDPSLFHDDDGRKWLVNVIWDHRYRQNRFHGICLQEYCEQRQRLCGEPKVIFRGSPLGLTEAPHLYKRKGYYYLLTAEGGTGYNHAMTMARSRNLYGPYELDPQGYLLTTKDQHHLPLQRCGHGSIVDTPQGESYIVHLAGRPLMGGPRRCPMGRETSIQKTEWSDDAWHRIAGASGDGLPSEEVEPPTGVEECGVATTPQVQHFDEPNLPIEFQWLRTPQPQAFMNLNERPGYLRLRGKESIGSQFEQALVARRQEHFVFEASCSVDFAPTTFQQMAGLCCYYNAHKFHYLYISITEDGRRFIDIMSCPGDSTQSLFFPLREGHVDPNFFDPRCALPAQASVFLKATVDRALLRFSWSLNNRNWQVLPVNLDYSVISDEAGRGEHGNFTGAFVGLCAQDTSGANAIADFDFFCYQGKSGTNTVPQ
ncbi:MAG: glycoside hydrolase family 43 protein [Cellvibrionaceae bacterium]|nr:glycoside hydrolase family 43 protein [Cellvibrionaceae bacterium]